MKNLAKFQTWKFQFSNTSFKLTRYACLKDFLIQHQIVKERGLLGKHTPGLHLSGFADEYGQNEEKRGKILRISYEFRNHHTPTT